MKTILFLGVFGLVLLLGVGAYAMGNHVGLGQLGNNDVEAYPNTWHGMGSGHGGYMHGHDDGDRGYAGPHDEGNITGNWCNKSVGDEYRVGRHVEFVNVSGVVVDVNDRSNMLIIQLDDGSIVRVKVLHTYMDVSNGYLISGVWIFERVKDMVNSNETVNITVTGVGFKHHGAIAGLGLKINGLGEYMKPRLYDIRH